MEPDRYQYGHWLFIIGLLSLFLGLISFIFGVYILPNVVFGYVYNIPESIYTWHHVLNSQSGYTPTDAGLIICFIFFIIGAVCIFIAYLASNYIDNKIYYNFSTSSTDVVLQKKKLDVNRVNGSFMAMKIAFIIFLVFGVAFLFERLLIILL